MSIRYGGSPLRTLNSALCTPQMPSHSDFDPYHEWLGIEPHEQPADHYRLLGLARFETDRGRIIAAADERMAHVRSFQTGPRGALTQKLLNELATARICLLDAQAKAIYDDALGGRLSALEAQRRMAAIPLGLDAPPSASAAPTVAPLRVAHAPRRGPAIRWPVFALFCSVLLVTLLAVFGWFLARSPFHTSGTSHRTKAATETLRPQRPAQPTAEGTEPRSVIGPERNGEIVFPARLAKSSGDLAREEIAGDAALVFHSSGEEAYWEFRLEKPGYFKAELTYALKSGTEDAELALVIGERVKRCSLRSSGGLDQFQSDTVTIAVPQSGRQRLIVRPRISAGDNLALKEIRFMPISAKLTTGDR